MRIRWLPLGLLLFACLPDFDAPVDPSDDEVLVFEVPKGASPTSVGKMLIAEGFVSDELTWKLFTRQSDPTCIKAGKHEIKKSMSLNEVKDALCAAPLADDVPFTVLEGWRIIDIDAALAAKDLIEPGAYSKVAFAKGVEPPFPIESSSFEGYLYPETYKVPAGGVDVEKLLLRQLGEFQDRFLSKHPDGFGERTLEQVVIVASMLEREEPKPVNRPLVAGIMWKRVDRNFGLGIDATSRYTLPDWNDRKAFLEKLRDPEDPYNTRLKVGLPPTAIGNPTIESLEAAVKPEASEFMYYLHDAQQNLHPARNAAEHEANRAKYDVY